MEAIEQGDKSKFMQVIKRLNKVQVYQLIYTLDRLGYNLIH
jgi:NH3-dependent NAD+ synthetase